MSDRKKQNGMGTNRKASCTFKSTIYYSSVRETQSTTLNPQMKPKKLQGPNFPANFPDKLLQVCLLKMQQNGFYLE